MIENKKKKKKKKKILVYDFVFVKLLPLSDIKNNNTYKFVRTYVI